MYKRTLCSAIQLICFSALSTGQSTPILVKDIFPDTVASHPAFFTSTAHQVFFKVDEHPELPGYAERQTGIAVINTASSGAEILDPGTRALDFSTPTALQNALYYIRFDFDAKEKTLYKLEEGNPVPVQIGDAWYAPFDIGDINPVSHKNRIYFTRNYQIWQSDGTSAGTQLYFNPPSDLPSNYERRVGELVSNGDSLYFLMYSWQLDGPYSSGDLWRISGDPGDSGAEVLKNVFLSSGGGGGGFWKQADLESIHGHAVLTSTSVSSGSGNGYLGPVVLFSPGYPEISTGSATVNNGYITNSTAVINNRFLALTHEKLHDFSPNITYKNELWASANDGTVGVLKSFSAQPNGTGTSVGIANYFLYFAADDGSGAGQELWRTDGSAIGTILVKDINPGSSDSRIGSFATDGTRVYFSAFDGQKWGIWYSNANNPANTKLVAVFNTTVTSAPVADLFLWGDTLFFSGDDGIHGFELWRLDVTALPDVTAKTCTPLVGTYNGIFTTDVLTVGGNLVIPSCSFRVNDLTAAHSPIHFTNKVFLSQDSLLSVDDGLLNSEFVTAFPVGPDFYYSETGFGISSVPLNLNSGAYYVITQTDADAEIAESDETNNLAIYPVTVIGLSGLDALAQGLHSIAVYPNPADELIAIQGAGDLEDISVSILNPMGQLERSFNRQIPKQGRLELPVSDLKNGLYWLKISGKEGAVVLKKLVVNR